MSSVPIKPARQIARILPTTPHSKPRSPTLRCAYALIASASATGTRLTPGTSLPRSFTYQGVEAVIENGVARDILKAGMASLVPAEDPVRERFAINESEIRTLQCLYGRPALLDRGLA